MEQGIELCIDEHQIEGINALIVIFSRGILGCFVTVDEVVIETDLQGFDAIGKQLDGQPLAGCSLSRRRRTRQKYQFHTLATGYLVGNP